MLDLVLSNAARLGLLFVPAVLGALLTAIGVVRAPRPTIAGLNLYALYVAFPALIVHGLIDPGFTLPTSLGFWLVVPLEIVCIVLVAPVLARVAGGPEHTGPIGLIGVFGNVAYLGLPLALAVLGTELRGLISLTVAMHVALSVTVGPVLLARGSGTTRLSWRRLATQPLLWAPVVGLAARALPAPLMEPFAAGIGLLAPSAAPVALFLLGIYLATERSALRPPDRTVLVPVALRLVVSPLLALLCAWAVGQAVGLPAGALPVFVLIAGMPAAIGTFSIAEDQDTARRPVAATIAWSTVLSAVSLPVLASWVRLAG